MIIIDGAMRFSRTNILITGTNSFSYQSNGTYTHCTQSFELLRGRKLKIVIINFRSISFSTKDCFCTDY